MTDTKANESSSGDSSTSYGSVRYYDEKPFNRNQNEDVIRYPLVKLYLIAAIIVGILIISQAVNAFIITPMAAESTAAGNLSRSVDYRLPVLKDCASMDDDEILSYFDDCEYTIVDLAADDPGVNGIDVFKVPSDVDSSTAEAILSQGISKCSAVEASQILYGSWRFTTDHSSSLALRVRYADFQSGSIEATISGAMAYQGMSEDSVTLEGVDDNGNTYKEGTIEVDDGSKALSIYSWRVSVIELESVYDVGLPEDSYYVGVRIDKLT